MKCSEYIKYIGKFLCVLSCLTFSIFSWSRKMMSLPGSHDNNGNKKFWFHVQLILPNKSLNWKKYNSLSS